MPASATPPNILFLFTDDQRFDTIRALGNHQIITPTLDSLTARGTTFENAYIMGGSCPAVCMPSRAMLMTGRTLYHLEGQGQNIPLEHTLLGETLRDAGYRTFGTGKWHNGAAAYARSFTDGAKIFFGGMNDHWNVPVRDFDPSGKYPDELGYRETGVHSSTLFCDAAIDFLRDYQEDDPFFMYVSFMAPHDPRVMPPQFREMYRTEEIELPPNFMPEHPFDNGELRIRDELLAEFPRTPEEIRGHIADYYAMITHADAEIARVLEVLRATGRADNTIVIFAGDNGLAVGKHGLMGKQNMYEHSVHVPLVICGPGIPAGERRDTFCYLLDIYPTLCELVGAPTPESVEGRSLVPALRQPETKVRDCLHFAYRHVQRSVRREQYKLVEYAVEGVRTTQLFDLEADPDELDNLAADPAYAGEVERLRQDLRRWPEELGDTQEQGQLFWGD